MSNVDRVKIMSSRVQLKGECVIEYFHHKARLCREILLPFREVKMQIIEGLYYHDMCNYLMARTHMSEDDLLTDIKSYNNLGNARSSRFRSAETTESFNKNNGFSFNRHTDVKNRDTVQRLPPEMKSSVPKDMSNVTCHRCGIKGHIAPACTAKVQRNEKRSCFRCNGHVHRIEVTNIQPVRRVIMVRMCQYWKDPPRYCTPVYIKCQNYVS